MRTIKVCIPHDCGSEYAMERAVAECYGGDAAEAENDNYIEMYEFLASVARTSGLILAAHTDFGAVWSGTAAQCMQAKADMPDWAGIEEE